MHIYRYPIISYFFTKHTKITMAFLSVNFCGTKEKREENEGMISMGKKANAFFFPGSYFLSPFLLSS